MALLATHGGTGRCFAVCYVAGVTCALQSLRSAAVFCCPAPEPKKPESGGRMDPIQRARNTPHLIRSTGPTSNALNSLGAGHLSISICCAPIRRFGLGKTKPRLLWLTAFFTQARR